MFLNINILMNVIFVFVFRMIMMLCLCMFYEWSGNNLDRYIDEVIVFCFLLYILCICVFICGNKCLIMNYYLEWS